MGLSEGEGAVLGSLHCCGDALGRAGLCRHAFAAPGPRRRTPWRRQRCPSRDRGSPRAHRGTQTAQPRQRPAGAPHGPAAHSLTDRAHTKERHRHTTPAPRRGRRAAGAGWPRGRTHRQHRSHRRTRAPAAHIQVAAARLPHRHVVSPPPVSSGEEKQTGSILPLRPSFHSWGQCREVSPPAPGTSLPRDARVQQGTACTYTLVGQLGAACQAACARSRALGSVL